MCFSIPVKLWITLAHRVLYPLCELITSLVAAFTLSQNPSCFTAVQSMNVAVCSICWIGLTAIGGAFAYCHFRAYQSRKRWCAACHGVACKLMSQAQHISGSLLALKGNDTQGAKTLEGRSADGDQASRHGELLRPVCPLCRCLVAPCTCLKASKADWIAVAVHQCNLHPGDEHLRVVRALPLVFALRHGHGVSACLPFHSLHGPQNEWIVFAGSSRGGMLSRALESCVQVSRMDVLERPVFVMLGESAPLSAC